MGTLEDQLKKWKQTTSSTAAESPKPSASTRRPSTRKDPFPRETLRRQDDGGAAPGRSPPAPSSPLPSVSSSPPSTPSASPPCSDAELFRRALDGVDDDAVLQKFAAAAPSTGRAGARGPVAPVETDEEMFRRFVGASRPVASGPTSERAAAPLRLSLRGTSVDVARRRLGAFLEEAVRLGAGTVVVEIDPAHDAALDAARGHPAVAAVLDAPSKEGGKGARLVRLR